MTNTDLKTLLNKLPPEQHESATKRIVAAELCGYHEIGFFEESPPGKLNHEFDLFGTDAQGRGRFLP